RGWLIVGGRRIGGIGDFRARVLAARDWPADERLDDRAPETRSLPADDDRTEFRHAAVLVGVVERGGRSHMVLTQRTASLRTHSGQVAFPGGQIDADDASPCAAALREADEEIGVPPAAFEVLGRMPDYITGTGYLITPV